MARMTKQDLAAWIAGDHENSAPAVAKRWEDEGLSRSKARRFYHEVKRLERAWKNAGKSAEKFRELLPEIKLLIAKVTYDKNRQSGSRLPAGVADWFTKEIKEITDGETFEQFVTKFEAVMGLANLPERSSSAGGRRGPGDRRESPRHDRNNTQHERRQ